MMTRLPFGISTLWVVGMTVIAGCELPAQDVASIESATPRPFVFQGTPDPPFVSDSAPTVDSRVNDRDVILEEAVDVKVAEAAENARRMRFFGAIAENDKQTFVTMLNEGMDPDVILPDIVPDEFSARFSEDRLRYYVATERGFTAVMLATSLGNLPFVRFLLEAGADPMKMTQRHKTYALWLAGKSNQIEIMRCLMGISGSHPALRYRITVNTRRQEAILWHNDEVDMVLPISSGRESHPTPTGRYLVTDKHRDWRSTLYDAQMPHFLRLSCGDIGFHAGSLPGYPASHGCIRLSRDQAKELFAKVPVGTLVEIE